MEELKVRKGWRFAKHKNKIYLFNLTTSKRFKLNGSVDLLFFILSKCKEGISKITLKNLILRLFNTTSVSFDKIIKELKKIGIFENTEKFKCNISKQDLIRLDRQIDFFKEVFPKFNPCEIQEKIKNTKVAILGLGTVAHNIIPHLLASGIGNFKCVDFDIVEQRNLGRQFLFTKKDLGKIKSKVVSDYIKQSGYNASSISVNAKLTNVKQIKKIIADCDIVVHCCDHPRFKIHRLINKACLDLNKPNIVATPGRLGPFSVPYKSACYECLELFLEKKFKGYGLISKIIQKEKDSRFPGLAIIVSLTGVLVAKEIISFILGCSAESINGLLSIDHSSLKILRLSLPRQKRCPACSSHKNNYG